MPKLNLSSVPGHLGADYPQPFDKEAAERIRQRLGDAGALTQFGVNLLRLPPGAWSSQRHWHSAEDEFVWVLTGTVVLVTADGEALLGAGDCAAFPRGVANGHHLVNRSAATAICLEIGSRTAGDVVVYPDIDMIFDGNMQRYVHRDGSLYPSRHGASGRTDRLT